MNDMERAAYFEAKAYLAHQQSALTDLQAHTERDVVQRYLAVGVNAAERHANHTS